MFNNKENPLKLQNAFRKNFQNALQSMHKQEGLWFKSLLTCAKIMPLIVKHYKTFRSRIFDPYTTLLAFITQALSPEKSLAAIVQQVHAELLAQGKRPCSASTGAYAQARIKTPLDFLKDVFSSTIEDLKKRFTPSLQWRGKNVRLLDGTTFTLADTKDNQAAFPKTRNAHGAQGMPMARLVV